MAQARTPGGGSARRSAIGRKVADVTLRAWTGYWTRRAEHATIAILHGLDDRALKDIGLDRSEIESVVYGAEGRATRSGAETCALPRG